MYVASHIGHITPSVVWRSRPFFEIERSGGDSRITHLYKWNVIAERNKCEANNRAVFAVIYKGHIRLIK